MWAATKVPAPIDGEQYEIVFDPEAHEYQLIVVETGAVIAEPPSVTRVLSFGQDLSRIPAWTAHRGTAFHLSTEYYDAGDLDFDSIDPLVKPHVDAYIEWHNLRAPTYVCTEEKVWAELDGMLYCGTVDRVMLRRDYYCVVDLKSGSPRTEHGYQLAAYKHAVQQRFGFTDVSCMGLYCTKDAKWVEKDYNGAHLLEGFRQKLRAYYEANGGE